MGARAVDRELRMLFAERRRQDALLAEHLRLVGRDRGYLAHGFNSLEAYAAESYGLPARSLYRLLALHRAFERLSRLRRAFLTGPLTARQVVLVSSVATCATLDAWMRRAEAVALKRLEDEIDFWRHLKETRPAVWGKLDGLPLPPELSLAPGRAPRLPASAPAGRAGSKSGPVSAVALLRALEDDEAGTPLPERPTVIKLWLEPEVRDQWLAVLADLRANRGGELDDLKEWQALALALKDFWTVWDNALTRKQRRENPILERDGWRCMVPWCRSVGTGRLHVHHVIPRSEEGGDEPWNLISMCVGCHLGLLHEGRIRVTGRAPDEWVWELGLEPGREPFAVFRGHVKVTRESQ